MHRLGEVAAGEAHTCQGSRANRNIRIDIRRDSVGTGWEVPPSVQVVVVSQIRLEGTRTQVLACESHWKGRDGVTDTQ